MAQLIVLTAIGTDRCGLVTDISKAVLDCSGNIEESRMVSLGAEFTVTMLISGNWHTLTKLEKAFDSLSTADGLTINLKKTTTRTDQEDCIPYGLDVVCIDQPGIVFSLAEFFAARKIEISDIATRRYTATQTGAAMFSMQLTANIPGTTVISQLRDDFLDLCEQLNLDSILEPVKQ